MQVSAIDVLAPHLLGRDVEDLLDDMGSTWRELVGDSQLRWLGPEKGVMHMAIGAVVNALWDLESKRAHLPTSFACSSPQRPAASRSSRTPWPPPGPTAGPYRLGSLDVEVRSGIARLTDTDTIAGSTLTQDAAVRAAVAAGASVEGALHAATSVPAAAIGRDTEVGRLQPGSRADVVLLDHALTVRAVWVSGRRAV